jgi:hypothetical protein
VPVTAGESLTIKVAGGGGSGPLVFHAPDINLVAGGGGGGYSGVFRGTSPVCIAGGGGGAAGDAGGGGGGFDGHEGFPGGFGSAQGGTQTNGGSNSNGYGGQTYGSAYNGGLGGGGDRSLGGAGGVNGGGRGGGQDWTSDGGAGGGGGYFGGGGSSIRGSGGGGGSSFLTGTARATYGGQIGTAANYLDQDYASNVGVGGYTTSQGTLTPGGDGRVVLIYTTDNPTTTPTTGELWRLSGTSVFYNAGNVGIGTSTPQARLHVNGDVLVVGNIAAKYQDVAEWVEATGDLSSGTVVSADPDRVNRVRAAAGAYDTTVTGVVSEQPGILLGERSTTKVAVAQSGRVRVKVDASYGAIKPGDLLVVSPRAGYAMRSEPVTIGGVTTHRPGTILGKALEPLAAGEGQVLVLLTLQ